LAGIVVEEDDAGVEEAEGEVFVLLAGVLAEASVEEVLLLVVVSVWSFLPNFSVNCGKNWRTPKKIPPTINRVIKKREKGVKRLIQKSFNKSNN
jgi:hypothetical protein